MFQSILIASLFFGLIIMLLPSDRKSDWIYFMIIAILFLSIGANLIFCDFSLTLPEFSYEEETTDPEQQALAYAVSREVLVLTGEPPLSVECDLTKSEDGYRLSCITVVLQKGDSKEVKYALQETFSFREITVIGENTEGSH